MRQGESSASDEQVGSSSQSTVTQLLEEGEEEGDEEKGESDVVRELLFKHSWLRM